ncbi:MAG: putative GTPase [Microbacterium sp.]|nr:putative GTPase [Microbacterium sp.]
MSRTIVIMGVCAPERRTYAERTALALTRPLHLLRHSDLRVAHALPLPRPRADDENVVVDLGTDVDLIHAIAARGGPEVEAVCVVDARHMIGDLLDDAPLAASARPGDTRGDVGARARQGALALELATRIVWVNWRQVPTAALAVQMALASHLNPGAVVRLSRDPLSDLVSGGSPRGEILERAGWVHAPSSARPDSAASPRASASWRGGSTSARRCGSNRSVPTTAGWASARRSRSPDSTSRPRASRTSSTPQP